MSAIQQTVAQGKASPQTAALIQFIHPLTSPQTLSWKCCDIRLPQGRRPTVSSPTSASDASACRHAIGGHALRLKSLNWVGPQKFPNHKSEPLIMKNVTWPNCSHMITVRPNYGAAWPPTPAIARTTWLRVAASGQIVQKLSVTRDLRDQNNLRRRRHEGHRN